MTYKLTIITGALTACLALSGIAAAQTATDLDCAGCVDSSDIAAGAVTTGKIANGAINNNKLAPEAVGTAKIQAGAVTADKLDAGSVGTAALQNGAVTTDKIQDGAVGLKKVGNTVKDHVTLLEYDGSATLLGGTNAYQKLRDIGTFEKLFNSSTVELDWQDHARWQDGDADNVGFCDFQLRVDDLPMPSDLNVNGTGRVVLYDGGNGTQNDAPVSITVFFPSLSSGIRAVSVWVRALDDDCTLNFGNFDRYVIVRERKMVLMK